MIPMHDPSSVRMRELEIEAGLDAQSVARRQLELERQGMPARGIMARSLLNILETLVIAVAVITVLVGLILLRG